MTPDNLDKIVAIIDKHETYFNINTSADYAGHGIKIAGKLVTIYTTPQEVVAFVDKERPDLVILAESYGGVKEAFERVDAVVNYPHQLPHGGLPPIKRGEGIAALERIREKYPNLPVYMISSNPQHRERATLAGATDYLTFVPPPEGLKALLNQHSINARSSGK